MKKFLSTLAVAGLATVVLASCSGKAADDNKQDDNGKTVTPTQTLENGDIYLADEAIAEVNQSLKGEYSIRLWVSEVENSVETAKAQVEEFKKLYPDIKITVTVDPVSESQAAGDMITDVKAGADIFCFAQDQLARLVQAKALSPIPGEVKARLAKNNDAGAVKAGTTAGEMYSYPLTSDNGYFMFYDKSVVKEEHLGDIMAILDDCADANKKFSYAIQGNGWYTGGVFFGAGCHSSWVTNQGGFFVSVDDDFKDKGLIAAKAIKQIINHPAYNGQDADKAARFNDPTPSAVVVSGTWDVGVAKAALGENYGAAELPSVTVDGKTFHLGSFSGNKLMGVKPQEDGNKLAVCNLLAEYMTLGKAQLQRFEKLGWGPSNVNAQKDEKVQKDEALSALAAQSAYAVPQGQIQGDWWTIVATLAASCKDAADDAALQEALNTYDAAIRSKLTTGDFKSAGTWSVIGDAVGGWDTDIDVAEPDDNGVTADGEYVVKDAAGADKVFEMAANSLFKLRRGHAWGIESNDPEASCTYIAKDGGNIKVLEAGSYKIVVKIVANAVKWVKLVPAE